MTPGDFLALPEWAPALLLAPLAALALWAADRSRARRLARIAGPRAGVLADGPGPRAGRLRRWLLPAGLLGAILAALQPRLGEGGAVAWRGADVVVCLDVSRSMLARDASPDRLEAARRGILALAERAEGDRFALVVFAGEAVLASPLTPDGEAFAVLAAGAGPSDVRRGGTDLGAALETALRAFEGSPDGAGAVLLLSDGEDHGQRGLRAAEALAARSIPVHAVGYGSPLGSKVTLPGDGGETYLRDASGREVVTALDPAGLRRIAEATGGTYRDAASIDDPLRAVHEEHVLPAARRAGEAEAGRERPNRFQWPLAVALVFWLLELALGGRGRREGARA